MRSRIWFCLLLLAIVVAVYARTAGHEFINFDDPKYVTENSHVLQGLTAANFAWAFTTTEFSNWHPATWLSHMADVALFGLKPGGHHLTSVLIHAASTCLLFLLLLKITVAPWRSLVAAALFALHPLRVESVAWVAERKDVLSGFFWLLAILSYARYVERPGSGRYVLALLAFVAGLMAKPMVVTLPLVLLLLDYWPFGRLKPTEGTPNSTVRRTALALIKEKLPFVFLAAVSCCLTVFAQGKGGAMRSMDVVPLALRAQNALVSYAKYMGKTMWPHRLAMYYPFHNGPQVWEAMGAAALVAAFSIAVIQFRKSAPYLSVGWFWLLITLVPVIGLVQVGGQSMADRYTYIPSIGLLAALVWGAADALQRCRWRKLLSGGLAGAVVAGCAAASWAQLGYWKDDVTLYRRTLEVTERNYVIHTQYGLALAKRGDAEGAVREYRKALEIQPGSSEARVNLGATLANQGKLEEAIEQYVEALRWKPGDRQARSNWAGALNNKGVALGVRGHHREAVARFEEALRVDPECVDAHFNLGLTLVKLNRKTDAESHFREVLRIKPESEEARRWVGVLGSSSRSTP